MDLLARDPTYVSERGAVACFLDAGRTEVRRALTCGLAGESTRDSNTSWYEFAAVHKLSMRTHTTAAELMERFTRGAVLLRIPRAVDAGIVRDEQALARWGRGPWLTSYPLHLLIRAQLLHGPLPMVATVGSFVVATWDIVDADSTARGLELTPSPAGAWAERVRDRRLSFGTGGRTLMYWSAGPYARRFA